MKLDSYTTYISKPSAAEWREMRKWICYRKYHCDGSFTETLVKDYEWWRRLKIRLKYIFRRFL